MSKKNVSSDLKLLICLIPFFELQSWDMLIEADVANTLLGILLKVYSGLRLLITAFLIYEALYKDSCSFSKTFAGVLSLVVMENMVSFINGSLFLNYLIGSFSHLGLAILCMKLMKKDQDCFIRICKCLFGILSVAGAVQIILMPYGFLHAADKAFAIYLLGSKNSSFFYYIVFLFFAFYDDLNRKGSIRLPSFAFLGLFIAGAIFSDSMNTLMMLLIMGMFAVLINCTKVLRRFVQPVTILLAASCIAFFILLSNGRRLLAPVLNMIGRNATFTGRDVLWEQAIADFKMHPFVGNGILTEFQLETGVWQDNAHSQFLDILAKYGIFVFLIYISITITALWCAANVNRHRKRIYALKCAVCFIVLFHSTIDHMLMYHFILLMSSVELLGRNIHGKL